MKVEIIGNTYADGKRIATQKVTYDKSDDLFALANLQRQLENIETHIAEASTETDIEVLLSEKQRIATEVAAQAEIVNGYEE